MARLIALAVVVAGVGLAVIASGHPKIGAAVFAVACSVGIRLAVAKVQ